MRGEASTADILRVGATRNAGPAGARAGCWTVDRNGARPSRASDEAEARAGRCMIVYCDTATEAEALWRAVMPADASAALLHRSAA